MKNWKLGLIIAAIVIAVILLIVFMIQGAQNGAINLEEQVNSAKSDIQVQEKRRVDLLYNLADCVKSYNEHEYKTLKDVIDSRSKSGGDIGDVGTMIAATAEAYPQLKSNENYKTLMNELSTTENMIAQFRNNYNVQVKAYNRYVRKFPTRAFLSMLGYEQQNYQYLDYNAPSTAPQNLFGDTNKK